MRAVLLIALFLLLLEFARHIGDKPQLAVDPVPAAAKAQAPICTAPWVGPLKKKEVVA
jgi:hypothetical protein